MAQAKRINEIALRSLFRDQGVGGSKPPRPIKIGPYLLKSSASEV